MIALVQYRLIVTVGLIRNLGVLLMSMTALASESYLHNMVDFIASVYLGYSLSFGGIITGMIWGFFDAAFGGFVFAWLYNKFI